MRRLWIIGVILSLVAGCVGSAAAGPGAGGEHVEWAHADWIDMNGNKGKFVGASGFRFVDAEQPGTFGLVVKGTCTKTTKANFFFIMCMGKGVAKEIPFEDLEIHPLMESASLEMKAAGYNHKVSWKGRGEGPTVGEEVASGDDWAAAGVFMDREATTRGRVFGRSLRSNGWLDWGFLLNFTVVGASAGAELQTEGLAIDLKPDGTAIVKRTIKIPR